MDDLKSGNVISSSWGVVMESKAVVNRRQWVRASALLGAAAAVCKGAADTGVDGDQPGRVRQSVAFWCFSTAGEHWTIEQTAKIAASLGCQSVELVEPKDWNVLERHGLVRALAPNGMPGPPFAKGFNNPRYQEEVIARTRQAIDECSAARFPAVIAFTGYKWRDADDPKSGEISKEEGADHCVRALKELARHAEAKGVDVCLEQLNTRDGTHPMKGHPGYQGDDLDFVADIVRRVGSPRVRLLFDIYHVQVMNGDVIRRLEENKDILGHIHTAGCPGRGELDERQELHYPAVIQKLVDIGYRGYVGQEFLPTGDPLAGLTQAVRVCNV